MTTDAVRWLRKHARGVESDTYHPVTTDRGRFVRHRWDDRESARWHTYRQPPSTLVTRTACGARSDSVAHVLSTVLDRAADCPDCFPPPACTCTNEGQPMTPLGVMHRADCAWLLHPMGGGLTPGNTPLNDR